MSNFGELLRQARAYKGVTLREAERATRINRQYLAALEQEEFADLPPLTYARGIVRNYAEYLGLDPLNVQAMFEEVHGQRSGGFQVVPAVKPLDIPSHWAPNFAIIAFMVVISAVIFAWLYSAYFAPPDLIPTPGTGGQSALAGTPESIVRQGGSEEPALSTPTPVPTKAPTATPTTAPTATPTPKPKPSPTPTPSTHT
ncbi:MAG: helix-turn-helix domain-containing protein, partial [Thermomicrobiaceae bacterium]|nr:helix-turn-helix domain-containing protein [Thermomicrobiaceae bacterium]